jgi:hypothetical protein
MKAIPTKLRFFALAALISAFVAFVILLSVNTVNAQYTGNENHVVTLDKAVKFIQNFRSHPTVPTIKGGHFARNIFEKILAQPGCVGIRYYYAALDDGSPTMVLVGVDGNGNDMEQGVIGETVYPCPPLCSSPNQLNK